MSSTPIALKGRRHDLDWLRVIAFGLLIFYHIGMFYVSWGWHVKSVYASPAAEPLMEVVNPWRLALLFFISGVAIRYAWERRPKGLVASRLFRLGVPIVFGIVVTVAPQTYAQVRQAGMIEPGYFSFWGTYLTGDHEWGVTTPTWNHLWYLVYLLVYVVLTRPFWAGLARLGHHRGVGWIVGAPWRLLLLVPLPFIAYELFLEPRFPTTHALWGDWANHAHRLTIFLIGFCLAKSAPFWAAVDRARWVALWVAIALLLTMRGIEANWSVIGETPLAPVIVKSWAFLAVPYAWSVIVTLLGFAQRYLNHDGPVLRYLTGAVFCYYVVHQTITVLAGYWLTSLRLGVWTEFLLLTAVTVGGCALAYEAFRRVPGLRVAFGIRPSPRTSP